MKNRLESIWLRPELAFALFALLLGARDVGAELLFKSQAAEARSCFAFLICLTITVLSLLIVVAQGDFLELWRKILDRRIMPRLILIGISAAVVYLVTFEMIGRLGSGVFDLFDYGLAPILTGALGVILFHNLMTLRLFFAACGYAVGIFLLFWGNQMTGWAWVSVALLSPVGTAVSDVTTKWLLSNEGGNMTRAELLFVRFLPATALIGAWIFATGGEIHLHFAAACIPLAVFGGFLPLWLLCTGLGRTALTKYAVWEFLIPAVAFFTTLPLHPEHLTLKAIFGAVIIILVVALHEIKWRSRLGGRRGTLYLSTKQAQPGSVRIHGAGQASS